MKNTKQICVYMYIKIHSKILKDFYYLLNPNGKKNMELEFSLSVSLNITIEIITLSSQLKSYKISKRIHILTEIPSLYLDFSKLIQNAQ